MIEDSRSEALAYDINRLTDDLVQAEQDMELYERLKASAATVKTLQKQLAAVKAELEKVEREKLKARLDRIKDVAVAGSDDPNLAHAVWPTTVTYRQSQPTHEHDGKYGTQHYPNIPSWEVWEWLLVRKPKAIPAEIMKLSPGDPEDALARYHTGLKSFTFRARSDA